MRCLRARLLLLGCSLIVAGAATAAPLYWWRQPDGAGGWQVRLINPPAEACPSGTRVLAEPDAHFDVRVCVAPLRARGVRIAGLGRVERPSRAERVIVLGDAGCDSEIQNCADPRQWPFAEIARRVDALDPDLIVHVGDFLYRGTCSAPVNEPHCVDDWREWEEDFFAPARPLLQGQAWVFTRGNHEDCQRGGGGWERLLASGSPLCALPTWPHVAPLDDFDIVVLDTSYAPPYEVAENDVSKLDRYTRFLDRVAALARRETWLLTHSPIWAFTGVGKGYDGSPEQFGNAMLQRAVRRTRAGELPRNVSLLLAGHIHNWQVITFAGGSRPPMLVAGNGGAGLSAPIVRPAGGMLDGVPADAWGTGTEYGFMVLDAERTARGRRWRVKPTFAPWSESSHHQCSVAPDRSGGCAAGTPLIPAAQ